MSARESRPAGNEAAKGSPGTGSNVILGPIPPESQSNADIANGQNATGSALCGQAALLAILDSLEVGDDEQLCVGEKMQSSNFTRRSRRVGDLRYLEPAQDRDCYLGMVVLDGLGVATDDAVRVLGLWADIDVKADGMKTWEAAWAVIDDLSRMLGSQPTVVIESGHGLQPVWQLEPDDSGDIDRISRVMTRFGELVKRVAKVNGGAADSVFDLARVLRMPGTVNHKDLANPVPTGLRVTGGGPLSLNQIEEALNAYDVPEPAERVAAQVMPVGGWEWASETCPYVTSMVAAWATGIPTSGRHPWAFAQQVRLTAARRLGCITQADYEAALRSLQNRLDRLRAPDGRRPGEVAADTRYAIAKVEAKSESECRAELGGHTHAVGADAEDDPHGQAPQAHRRTDRGNAHRLIALAQGRVLHNDAMGWLVWDGQRWARGREHEVDLLAQRVADQIDAEADMMERAGVSREEVARHRRWAKDTETAHRVRALKEMAKPHLNADTATFDSNPALLNVANGVLCLSTLTLIPHDPALRLTRLAPVSWDPDAKAPTFLSVLRRVQPDQTAQDFLQTLLGYGMTGHTGEQVFVVHWGSGGNGKSTILNAVRDVLGDYGAAADPATFAKKASDGSGPSPDRAALAGIRMVTCVEPNQLRLDPTFVKTITGGDPIVARELYKAPFTYKPQFLLNLVTNDRPVIDDGTDGMWRRVILFPWTVCVPEDERIPEHVMTARLRAELPGILRWLAEGSRAWARDGLRVPSVVREATEQYRESEDVVLTFLNEAGYSFDPQARTKLQPLAEAWSDWAKDNREAGKSIGGPRKLQERLIEKYGVTVKRTNEGRYVYGIRPESLG